MSFIYKFEFPNRPPEEFAISIASCFPSTQEDYPEVLPEWTELHFNRCPHCILDETKFPHCPLAVSIAEIIDRFEALTSFHETTVTITTEERTYTSETTIQNGLSSILGLVIATSGCPHTEFLRPMAHFHLPLSTPNETVFRAVGMYLIGQFFNKSNGHQPSFDLSDLDEQYIKVEMVNKYIAARLRTFTTRDAPINAIVLLDNLAKTMSIAIEAQLEDIRHIWDSCS